MEPEEPPTPVEPPPPDAGLPADRHILFVSDSAGYRLIERRGPCPVAGTTVELDLGSFLVARTGRAPFPGERVACAYLIAVR